MLNKSIGDKQRRYITKIETLLRECQILGNDTGISPNFVSLNKNIGGKYLINEDRREDLYELLEKGRKYGINFSLAEKPQDYGPVLVDIDINKELDDDVDTTERLYSNKLILKVIELYRTALKHYLILDDEELETIVMEKNEPTVEPHRIKDGFHLQFNKICINKKLKTLVREYVIRLAEDEKMITDLGDLNSIFDKATITNFWMVYGNAKPKRKPYEITKVLDINNEEVDFDVDNVVEELSLQKSEWCRDTATVLNEQFSDEIINNEFDKKYYDTPTKEYRVTSSEEEIILAHDMVHMLNPSRAVDYVEWRDVGLALHNIDLSLLDLWIEFSKQSPEKYKEGECERIWNAMKTKEKGLTMGSLKYWAKLDNYGKYNEYMKKMFNKIIDMSVDGSTYNIGKAFYNKYCDRFVYIASTKIWFEFRHHRWVVIDDGSPLLRLMSEEFSIDYTMKSNECNAQTINIADQGEKEKLREKAIKFNTISMKLLDIKFTKTILEVCKILFNREKFVEDLDSNKHLIGFDNGVFDSNANEFRDGRPEDLITFSTNNNYVPYNKHNPVIKDIENFFSQVFIDEDVRNYFLLVLSTCMFGYIREEKFYILTGSGSNGKTMTFDIIKKALGDYTVVSQPTLVTRKRSGAGAATPELARLKGIRCSSMEEPEDGEALNSAFMKELTGGNHFVTRGLYDKNMIEIIPQFKLFYICNDKPPIPTRDGGTWRRITVIDFNSKFVDNPNPEKDNEFLIDIRLKEKIDNWGGVFAGYLIHIFMTRYAILGDKQITIPQQVIDATNSYRKQTDYIMDYFNSRIKITDNTKNRISVREVNIDFKIWFKDYHEDHIKPDLDHVKKYLDEHLELIGNGLGWKKCVFKNLEEESTVMANSVKDYDSDDDVYEMSKNDLEI